MNTYNSSSKGLRELISNSRQSTRETNERRYGKKKKTSDFDFDKVKAARTQAESYVNLPDIGNETQTLGVLKRTVEDLKSDLNDQETKCAALKRNFESLSALLIKTENEKKNLETLRKTLQQENRQYAQEVLGNLQKIKSLQAELD